VLARGDGGMLSRLDRVLFRRQAECVPAHWMKDVAAAHTFVARHNVCRGVTFGMPDVQPRAARIREHVEDVELWLGAIEVFRVRIGSVKCPAFIPKALPLRLEPVEGIRVAAHAHVRLRLLSSRAKSRDPYAKPLRELHGIRVDCALGWQQIKSCL